MTKEEQRRFILVSRIKDNCYEVAEKLLDDFKEEIRAEAIDEFVEFANTMPIYENEYGEKMPMPIEMMANSLKNRIFTGGRYVR